MARIFLGVSVFAMVVLIYACIDGLLIGDYHQATSDFLAAQKQLRQSETGTEPTPANVQAEYDSQAEKFEASRAKAGWHMLLGTAATLVALLVNCLSVTYFIGTGRWCKEVCDTYKLDVEFVRRSDRLKRQTFPWSVGGILLLLAIISTGPPSDPLASLNADSQPWVAWHRYISIGATVLMAGAFVRQIALIREHYRVIGSILEEVRRVRDERGLDTAEE